MKRTRLAALALSALLLAGCARTAPAPGSSGPPQPSGSAPAEGNSGPKVQVDWSRLEGNKTGLQPDLDGGRWYPGYTPALVPSEDYAPLIPYMGALTYTFNTWTDNSDQEQVWYSSWPTALYGLMTREGKTVTDPVYLTAEQADFYWQGTSAGLPVLLLSQAREEWNSLCNGRRYAVAAQDGSWVTDFEFWTYTTREDEVLLCGPGGVTWIDAVSGAREDWSWELLGVTEEELPQTMDQIMWLYGFQWTDAGVFLGTEGDSETQEDWENAQIRVFRPENTEVVRMSRQEWEEQLSRWSDLRWPPADNWESTRNGEQLTLSRGGESYSLSLPGVGDSFSFEVCEPYAYICDFSEEPSVCWLFRLSDGELLTQCDSVSFITDPAHPGSAPYILVRGQTGSFTFYSPGLEPLFTFPALSHSDTWLSCAVQDGLLTVWDDRTFYGCYDLDAGTCIFYRNLALGD